MAMNGFSLSLVWLLAGTLGRSCGFVLDSPRSRQASPLFSSRSLASDLEEERTRESLIRAVLQLQPGETLTQIHIVGEAELPAPSFGFLGTKSNRTCAVLSQTPIANHDSVRPGQQEPCLLLPLPNPNQLTLLRAAAAQHESPVSKVTLLGWNSLAVNRDGGLFDNLPYSAWTIDPYERDHRDAAGNPILERFHMGKRDAYNRMLGKDWIFDVEKKGPATRRQSEEPLAGSGLSVLLEKLSGALQPQQSSEDESTTETDNMLVARILELQLREVEMDVAEWDYQLAVARQNEPDRVGALVDSRRQTLKQMEETKARLTSLQSQQEEVATQEAATTELPPQNIVKSILSRAVRQDKNQPAPYPAATGYAPLLDYNSTTVYNSPYDMFQDILRDQMKAEVIGAVLENTSLLKGTLALGGALVLRRISATKEMNLLGERLKVEDESETFGNDGVMGGTTLVVECDADEAIGMSLACRVPLLVEKTAWERGSVMATKLDSKVSANSTSLRDVLPEWVTVDPELSVLTEGEAGNLSMTERVSPIRIPRTTTNLFDEMTRSPSRRSSGSSEMFPTDNPIQSLEAYDNLDNEDKARTLLGMSNFNGRLPRPRALRQSAPGQRNALDDLLLPLADESVRNQYFLRDAKRRGDTQLVAELEESKSRRQIAKEKAARARDAGVDDVADWWENEADFLASLRADPTQDEGSYSRFLDRDEWYERTRRNQAKKLTRKKFGTLLDGME